MQIALACDHGGYELKKVIKGTVIMNVIINVIINVIMNSND